MKAPRDKLTWAARAERWDIMVVVGREEQGKTIEGGERVQREEHSSKSMGSQSDDVFFCVFVAKGKSQKIIERKK